METTGDRFIRIFGQRAWQRVREEGFVVVDKADLDTQLAAYNLVKKQNQILQKHIEQLEVKRRRISSGKEVSDGQAVANP